MKRRRFAAGWFLLSTAFVSGCNSAPPPQTSASVRAAATPTASLAETVHETLRRADDLPSCRRLVEQLNVAIARPNAEKKPGALAPELAELYAREFGLSPREMEEIARAEFTPLDAHSFEESCLFCDLVKSLDVAGLSPLQRAVAAQAWVTRNIRPIDSNAPAVPPVFAARRGTGTVLERTYVFLAILRQLDIDAVLIGDAGGQSTGFWAVGVCVDKQIYLFDMRLGIPLPGPDGILTLAQARKDDKAFAALNRDERLKYDVDGARSKASVLYLAAPISTLAPRNALVQNVLPDGNVRLTTDLVAKLPRLQSALSESGVEASALKLWNSPAVDALPRVQMTFLPPSDGGTDSGSTGQRRQDRYYLELVPWGAIPPFLMQLSGEAGDRIRSSFADRILSLKQPGRGRDLMIRGRFQEANEQLVALQTQIDRPEISPRDLEENSRGWADAAREVYADLLRSERLAKTDPAAAGRVPEIREKIENLWKKSKGPILYLGVVAGPFLNEEATFLLASGRHEQAERLSHRQNAASDPAAWATARKWWTQFVAQFPGSAAMPTVRRNLAEAWLREGNAEAARKELLSLSGDPALTALEKLACVVRAAQLK